MMYTVIDIETTGLSKHRHRITEIGAAKFNKGIIEETFHTLVNPQQKIPSFITKLTGISNSMVQDAPTIENVIPNFLHFLSNDIFVAHNATFDFNFLNHNALQHYNTEIKNPKLCTRMLASRLLPHLPSKRLDCLCEEFNIVNHQHHRAMGDVQATTEVLQNFLHMLKQNNIHNKEDILKFQSLSTRKASEYLLTQSTLQ